MILRRIAQHMKQQHWTGVFIELVIVVLGVFIGLQVDNWNQARQDHAAEIVYLHSLSKDLGSIHSSLQKQVQFETGMAHAINRSFNEINAPRAPDRTLRLGMLLSQLAARSTLKIESPTFQELQSSGRLGLIRDPALRARIVDYFFQIRRWESALDQNNSEFIDHGYNVFLRDSGVELVFWDPAIMHEPSILGSIVGDDYRVMQANYGKRILSGRNPVLDRPPGDAFWIKLHQQLNWRAFIAGRNQLIAMHIQTSTVDLQGRIAAYLKTRSR